jgi:Spy/CpxP family protein refolding chaperone
MWFSIITLATALTLSISAAYYSILGLTAIFAAAFWPIVILGSSLEVGKIVSTLWLHKYWHQAELQYKVYLSAAVAILMVLTSMGVFGFLSKSHSDQGMVSGDVMAKISIYDEKIKQSRDNISVARSALTQMDAAVDQTMSRSTSEQGADKAAQLRRSQAPERTRLLKEIETEQRKIQALNDQRAPIAAEVRKVEAEVGPLKYIAALIYGDNPEANVLEKAVRWVIILIVVVFDPLALTLLIAATKSMEWERAKNPMVRNRRDEPDNISLTEQQLKQINDRFKEAQEDPEVPEFFDRAREKAQAIDADTYEPPDEKPVKKTNILDGLDNIWSRAKQMIVKDSEADPEPLNQPVKIEEPQEEEEDDDYTSIAEKQARRFWKEENPGDTLKHQKRLYRSGQIEQLPWNDPDFRERTNTQEGNLWIPGQDGEWINAGPMDRYNLGLQVDNSPTGPQGEVRGFGTSFPLNPFKGDMFLRVDQLPSVLYKFNGNRWIEVDKSMSDQHAYDDAYIDHLIEKIGTGEYDPELLTDAERDRIEQKLNNN